MKIYTKTGDKGETGYLGGRIQKDSLLIDVVGNLDELNSYLGVCVSVFADATLAKKLKSIESQIFAIGAILADKDAKLEINYPVLDWLADLEEQIDVISEDLPVLENFIMPNGILAATTTHHARSIARRVERSLTRYQKESEDQRVAEIAKYLNRLSDFLFVLARSINYKSGQTEELWQI